MESKKQKSLLDILNKGKSGSEKVDKLFNQVMSKKSISENSKYLFIEYFNKAMLYYYGKLPANSLNNASDFRSAISTHDFVDQVLYRVVNADIPNLLDAFTSDKSLACAIRSRGWRGNPQIEDIITLEINKHFRDNFGFSILRNAIKTLLISGNADVKVFVDEYEENDAVDLGEDWVEISEFLSYLDEGWTIKAPKNFMDKSGSIKGFSWKQETVEQVNQQTGETEKVPVTVISGNVPIINKVKKLVIEEVEPLDIIWDTTYGSDYCKVNYVCHKIQTTVGDAIARGFDPEDLKESTQEKMDYSELPEMFFTANYDDPTAAYSSDTLREAVSPDDMQRAITLYEHYTKSSIPNKKGETRWYQVVTTNAKVLKVTEVKRHPFIHGVMEQVQGQFFGRGWFDVVKPYQDANSLAMRLHQHNAVLSTYPQYLAVKGQYDRQSLQNNRPGAVIEQLAQQSVERFEPFHIADTFITAMQGLKESEQETLAQPIGVTNSDGGIPQVATATAYLSIHQDSQKGAIRKDTIEQTFINPLFCLMYETLKDEGMITAPDGTPIDSKQLPKLYDVIVDSDTTHDDFAQQLQLSNIAQLAIGLTQAQASYLSDQNKYAILASFCNKADLNPAEYLTDPSTIPPDPHAAEEAAEQQAIASEAMKVQLQSAVLDLWLKGAKVITEQATAEKITKEAHNTMAKDQADSQAKIQKIMSDAQAHAQAAVVKQNEVDMKQDLGNKEFILAANQHAHDIASAKVNGVR